MRLKDKSLKILGYIVGVIGAIIVLPFVLIYYLLRVFWHAFGAAIIAFIIIGLFGGTMEDCIQYSSGLGFFVAIIMKYREMKNK